MTIRNASVHKDNADTKTALTYDYDQDIFDAIEAECIACVAANPPVYDAFFEYPIALDNLVEQPDESTIDYEKFINMLNALGYTVAHQAKYGKLKIHVRF